MKLQLESWNRYLSDTSTIEGFTVEQELEFDRVLNEAYEKQSLILEDLSKLIEHYSSGGVLLESKECFLIEKKLNKDKDISKVLSEIKRNPKRLDEAGLLTAASIPTAIGLLSRIFGWVLEKGVKMYISSFEENTDEYIDRMSSSEEIANQIADPTLAPSVASGAGRGFNPSDKERRDIANRERTNQYRSAGSDVRGRAAISSMTPFQKKAISAILDLSEGSTKFGTWIQSLVKKAMIKVSQLFGKALNYLCRDEQEREQKKQSIDAAFEKVGLLFYCSLIAAGAIYLVDTYAIPKAYGAAGTTAQALNKASSLIDGATATVATTSAKAEIASIKSNLADAIDASTSVAKAEKTVHFKEYASKIWNSVKQNLSVIFTETLDIISDCGKKAASTATSGVSGIVNKFKNWWNKED